MKTMNYIVSEIVDKFENNSKLIQSWYDFIWDRTRAIRKDITIQRLTGSNTIEILEKCSRFHILCSYKLCEEQSNVFDFKINEENLVNCLQILKELYKEISLNSNECSNNESEFLCYYILQNLDQDQLILEIPSIHERIKNTVQFQFAVKLLIAYKTNNYYEFIRLLFNSTLLQACILNRYLNKIRLIAFRLIWRSVVIGTQKIFITQNYFMKQLLFKEHELKKFCKLINCDFEDDKIVFTKCKELNLDVNFKLNRNVLIDQKFEKLKLSDIVNGINKDDSGRSGQSVDQLLDLFKKVDFFNNPD